MHVRDAGAAVDDQTIELIAARIADAVRDNLDAFAGGVLTPLAEDGQLTVEQVARRLGVARSTVYAHWREWGGYKLGSSPKAPIRFDGQALVRGTPATPARADAGGSQSPPTRRCRRHDLLGDAPRFAHPLDDVV